MFIRKITTLLFFIFFACVSFAQSRRSVDSINSISFEVKLAQASSLVNIYRKNASDAHNLRYSAGEAESYSNLSLVYYYLGKYENNIFYSLKAISIFEQSGENEKLALEYGELGYRLKNWNMPKALFYLQKGKQLAESNKLQKPLLSIYNNYGVLKEIQKQYDSALYFYTKGLTLKEKINDSTGIPYSLNNIAGIYTIRKQYNEAKKYYDRSIQIRKKLNDQIGLAENFSYYGDLFLEQKKYTDAITYYEKALNKSTQLNYSDLIQYSYKKLSECYENIDNQELAFSYYKKFTQFKDTLLNNSTNSKIAELEVRFETAQKEKLILQKDSEALQSRNLLIAISTLAFFIALTGFLLYRQQKLKNKQQEQKFRLTSAIRDIEAQNQLYEQRLSISRDLHDNIGAQLTFIISSIDNLNFENRITDKKISDKLVNISEITKSTILELRDTIWAMNSNEITFSDLRSRIFNFVEKARSTSENMKVNFSIDEKLENLKISSQLGINLYRTIQEAVNNAIKHAEASTVSIQIGELTNEIEIEIKDNGKGIDFETVNTGNGLNNMKKRIEECNGTFGINSHSGTIISICFQKKNLV